MLTRIIVNFSEVSLRDRNCVTLVIWFPLDEEIHNMRFDTKYA